MQHRQLHRRSRITGVACLFLTVALLLGGLFATIRIFAEPGGDVLDQIQVSLGLPDALSGTPSVSYVNDWSSIAYLALHPDADLSDYRSALRQYIDSTDLSLTKDIPAKLRMALVFSAIAPDEESDYIQTVLSTCAGNGNIMNYITGLILADSHHYDFAGREALISHLLDIQFADGGWALTGTQSDTDVTSMALAALAPHRDTPAVATAVDKALSRIRALRRPNGEFASYGVENAESSAQVSLALCALGLDPDTWFNDGLPALTEVIRGYALSDGSFSHVHGGTSNPMATYQAFQALAACRLLREYGAALYDFDALNERKTPPPDETGSSDPLETDPHESTETNPPAPVESDTETKSPSPETETDESQPGSGQGTETESTITPESDQSQPVEAQTEPETRREESEREPDKETNADDSPPRSATSVWKWIAAGAVLLGGGIAILALALSHHLTPSRWIPVAVAVLVLLGIVLFAVRFESVDDHFHVETSTEPESGAPVVTIDILCYNALSSDLLIDLPQDGILLKETTVLWTEDLSVWDVLDYVCRANGIVTTHNGDDTGAYVTGIGGLYEMDCGDLSGWVYVVNGTQPSKGCGTYICEPGDRIHWVYSLELGRDVKEGSYDWNPNP